MEVDLRRRGVGKEAETGREGEGAGKRDGDGDDGEEEQEQEQEPVSDRQGWKREGEDGRERGRRRDCDTVRGSDSRVKVNPRETGERVVG